MDRCILLWTWYLSIKNVKYRSHIFITSKLQHLVIYIPLLYLFFSILFFLPLAHEKGSNDQEGYFCRGRRGTFLTIWNYAVQSLIPVPGYLSPNIFKINTCCILIPSPYTSLSPFFSWIGCRHYNFLNIYWSYPIQNRFAKFYAKFEGSGNRKGPMECFAV